MDTVEKLPFWIQVVRTEDDLRAAVGTRHEAYARHLPELAEKLKVPEPLDFEQGSVVLLARSKLDEAPLGTIRIQTNEFGPLALESSVTLPERFAGKRLAEATRLGTVSDRMGRLVKIALFKAYYLYCLDHGVDEMVICARAPLDKQYELFLYKDAFSGGEFFPMKHAADVPHRVMCLATRSAGGIWARALHPLYDYFVTTRHPDIDLTGSTLAAEQLRLNLDIDRTQPRASA